MAGLGAIGLIIAAILLPLSILLLLSNSQIIAAYLNNSGSYIVAKDNLGPRPGCRLRRP